MKPYQTVIDIIRDLAREQPNRTSQDQYFDYEAKTPECIFGHALAILGAVPAFESNDHCGGSYVVRSPEGEVLAKGYQSASAVNWAGIGVEPPSEDEAAWSDTVQSRQDGGATWGEAVKYADEAGIL